MSIQIKDDAYHIAELNKLTSNVQIRNKVAAFKQLISTATVETGVEFRRSTGATFIEISPYEQGYDYVMFGNAINTSFLYLHIHHNATIMIDGNEAGIDPVPSTGDFVGFGKFFKKMTDLNAPGKENITSMISTRNGLYAMRISNAADALNFYNAALRAKEWFALVNNQSALPAKDKDFIFVKSEYRQLKIDLNQVQYFEGLKDYIKIWIEGNPKPILTLMSMKSLEEELPPQKFMRIHRSFIISLSKVQTIERNQVLINKERITVADQYKATFREFIKDNSID